MIDIGDKVELHQVFDDGWALGQNRNATGIFPLECIGKPRTENKKYTARVSSFPKKSSSSSKSPNTATVLLTEKTSAHVQNAANVSNGVIQLKGLGATTDNGAALQKPDVGEYNNRHSSVTVGSLARSIAGESPPLYQQHEVTRGVAKFVPTAHDEIEVQIGDHVVVQKRFDDKWGFGVNLTSQMEGHFPLYSVGL